jgi:hypothetical protein
VADPIQQALAAPTEQGATDERRTRPSPGRRKKAGRHPPLPPVSVDGGAEEGRSNAPVEDIAAAAVLSERETHRPCRGSRRQPRRRRPLPPPRHHCRSVLKGALFIICSTVGRSSRMSCSTPKTHSSMGLG